MSAPTEVTVTLFTKPGCHLCEPVAEAIVVAARERTFHFESRNILDDPATFDRYRHAIPVVTVNGVEVARYRMTFEQILAAIDAASRP